MRASNLQDLVYKNGQGGITKATVSITFDNSNKSQSPLGFETHDEITVTRQVGPHWLRFPSVFVRLLLALKLWHDAPPPPLVQRWSLVVGISISSMESMPTTLGCRTYSALSASMSTIHTFWSCRSVFSSAFTQPTKRKTSRTFYIICFQYFRGGLPKS